MIAWSSGRSLPMARPAVVSTMPVACLLGLLGIAGLGSVRIDIDDLGIERGHRTVTRAG